MLKIRFLRTGKKHQPFFKIIVCDKKTSAKSGKFLESLGFFNPLTKEKNLKNERIKHWLSVGAQPSDRVYNILVGEKIIKGKKRGAYKQSKKEKGTIEKKPAAEQQKEIQDKTAEKPQKEEKEREKIKKEKATTKMEEKKEKATTKMEEKKEKATTKMEEKKEKEKEK